MKDADYLPIATASRLAGVPEPALRAWVASGALPARDAGSQLLVHLDAVRALAASEQAEGNAETPEGGALVVAEAPRRPPSIAALMLAIVARLDGLYSDLIAAKDDQIAAQGALITELRRRIAEQDHQRERATSAPTGPVPAPVPSGVSRRPRGRRLFISVAVALIVVVILATGALVVRYRTVAQPASSQAGGASGGHPFAIAGLPLVASAVLGDTSGLLSPSAAAPLPGGYIAVLDAGHRRVVTLDARGHLAGSGPPGQLRAPIALAATPSALYVLDAGTGTIERYDVAGRFVRLLVQSSVLLGARGLATGPGGQLYVANPRRHDVVVIDDRGRIVARLTAPRDRGRDRFVAPSDVAVGATGTVFVLDAGQGRILALRPTLTLAGTWPAPPADAAGPARLLPLSGGRLLVAGAMGSLFVYMLDSSSPVFSRALTLPARGGRVSGPLGLARLDDGHLLVTDTRGNRLLIVPMP